VRHLHSNSSNLTFTDERSGVSAVHLHTWHGRFLTKTLTKDLESPTRFALSTACCYNDCLCSISKHLYRYSRFLNEQVSAVSSITRCFDGHHYHRLGRARSYLAPARVQTNRSMWQSERTTISNKMTALSGILQRFRSELCQSFNPARGITTPTRVHQDENVEAYRQ
jgi:hypothetical protein